jgi:hypothetical protein
MPGSNRPCLCSTGDTGHQACNSDGSGFGQCAPCPAPIAIEAIVKTCALQLSCMKKPFDEPGSTCIGDVAGGFATGMGNFYAPAAEMRRVVDCATAATDCTSALTCVTLNHPPAYCAAHPGISCDGEVIVDCPDPPDWPVLAVFDCSTDGLHCMASQGKGLCTNNVACASPGQAMCDPQNQQIEIFCNPDLLLQEPGPCTVEYPGGSCGKDGLCVLPTPSCSDTPRTNLRCEGNTMIRCFLQHEAPIDCTQLESHCERTDGGFLDCITDAHDCGYKDADHCNGDSLEICANGRYLGVDCKTIGFRTCGTLTDGNPACVN